MIIAILPDPSSAEILLNNLSEADFDLSDVTLILRDTALRDRLAPDAGPLKGLAFDQLSARLLQAGLPASEAASYQDAVAQGKVFAAMTAAPDVSAAAQEMFSDQSAESIKEIK